MTLSIIFICVAYALGTYSGYLFYKKSLVGKVMIAFDRLLDEMNKNQRENGVSSVGETDKGTDELR